MRDTVFDRNNLYKRPSVIQILSFFLIEPTLSWRLGITKGNGNWLAFSPASPPACPPLYGDAAFLLFLEAAKPCLL